MADLAPLRDLIARGEVGSAHVRQNVPTQYDVIVNLAWQFPEARPPRLITTMAVDEVLDWQRHAIRVYQNKTGAREGYSAAGFPQIIMRTLAGLIGKGVAHGAAIYNATTQMALCDALIRARGLDRWLSGAITAEAFADALAQEWASFPVMQARQGANRWVEAGQSYYQGDGKNAAKIKPAQVLAALAAVRQGAAPGPAPLTPTGENHEARLAALEAEVATLRAFRAGVLDAAQGGA